MLLRVEQWFSTQITLSVEKHWSRTVSDYYNENRNYFIEKVECSAAQRINIHTVQKLESSCSWLFLDSTSLGFRVCNWKIILYLLESLHLWNHKLKYLYFKQRNFYEEQNTILSKITPVIMKKFGKCPVFLTTLQQTG